MWQIVPTYNNRDQHHAQLPPSSKLATNLKPEQQEIHYGYADLDSLYNFYHSFGYPPSEVPDLPAFDNDFIYTHDTHDAHDTHVAHDAHDTDDSGEYIPDVNQYH